MGKGSNTTSTSTTSAPNPQAAQAYSDLLTRAQGVASTPYQGYTGELTAPVNAQQTQGINNINANANFAQAPVNQALGIAGNAANPLTQAQIQQYQNPYTQDVVNATQAQFNNQNAQAQQGLTGNAIAQGALGGNRVGVAQANLAGQQQLAQAPVIAGLYNQSYQQGLATAGQQFQQNPLAAAGQIANFGISGQGAALSGAGAQLGAGTLQQQTQQAQDQALYNQYAQAQAYPYQQTQWLAGIDTGVGSNLGGTSSGQTTAPAPNQTAQWIGAGLSAAALLSDRRAKEGIERIGEMNDGTPIYRFRYKGSSEWHVGPMAQDIEKSNPSAVSHGVGGVKYIDLKAATDDSVRHRARGGGVVPHMANGGVPTTPWASGVGWIPQMQIHGGPGAPHASAPSVPQQSGSDASKFASGLAGLKGGNDWLGNTVGAAFNPEAYGASETGMFGAGAYGGSSASPLEGLSAADYGAGFKRGGVVGYAGGGAPGIDYSDPSWDNPDVGSGLAPANFADRFAPANDSPFGEMSRGQGLALGIAGKNGTVAPQSIPGGEPEHASDPGFVYRDVSPDAMDDWRKGNPVPPVGTAPMRAADDSDAEEPANATPTSGIAGPSGGAYTPPYQITPADYAKPASDPNERGGFGLLPISRNVSSGLLAAGLGMLASRSPNLGNAIGEGGLSGFAAYGSAEERDRKVAEEAQKLSLEAKTAANALAHQTFTTNEQVRHNKAVEQKEFKPTYGVVREEQDPDTGMLHKVYGWIDPNTKTAVPESRVPEGSPPPAPKADANGLPLTGQTYLDTLPTNRATLAKQIADYKVNPMGLSVRGGHREQAIADATRYNPDYDQRLFTSSSRAMSNFYGGPEGRTVRSLNVAIDHLHTLDSAVDALKNGQIPAANKLVNYFSQQTGSPVTTNFDSIKHVVSAEIAKAVVGGQTALHDRDDMAARAANSGAPEQLHGIVTEFKKLMAGQMKGLRKQYEVTTRAKNFDDFLEPQTKKELAGLSPDVEDNYTPSQGGSSFTPPAGAIPRVYNGKTYYYDPQTKQPFPGQ